MPVDPDSSLNHEDIGIYFFGRDGYVHNYKVKNYGVLFDDFKKVERKLEDISEILTGAINYGRENYQANRNNSFSVHK